MCRKESTHSLTLTTNGQLFPPFPSYAISTQRVPASPLNLGDWDCCREPNTAWICLWILDHVPECFWCQLHVLGHALPCQQTVHQQSKSLMPAAKPFLLAYGGNIIGQEQLNRLTISMLCVGAFRIVAPKVWNTLHLMFAKLAIHKLLNVT